MKVNLARWLEIERQRRHHFTAFSRTISIPLLRYLTKIQQYVAEVQSYLKWSHWAQRLLWFAIGTCFDHTTFYGTIVADLIEDAFLTWNSVEHAPPYAHRSSNKEAFNARLKLKAEDQIEAQAAERGGGNNAPYQEAALQARKDELAFNAGL